MLHILYYESSIKPYTIYKCIAKAKFSPVAHEQYNKPGPEVVSQHLNRILEILDKMPFASCHVIANILKETYTIVYRYLTDELGLVYKHSL